MAANGMTDTPLKKAIQCLKISDVWQARVEANIDPALQTTQQFPDQYEVQFKHLISKSLWGESDGNGMHHYMLRAFIDVGIRYVNVGNSAQDLENGLASGRSNEPVTLAQIEASYVAEYLAGEDPGEEAIKAFVSQNVSFHIWPYWREFIASQCNRMNLPRVALPLHNFGVNEKVIKKAGSPTPKPET